MTREDFMYELNDLLTNYKKGNIIPSNKIILNGTPMGKVTLFTTDYLVGYRFTLAVKRENGKGKNDLDYLEIVVPIENEYMFDKNAKRVQIIGKVCSTFVEDKLQFYVEVTKMGYDEELDEDVNWLYLEGNVVKAPRIKETFRGLKVCNLDLKVFNFRERQRTKAKTTPSGDDGAVRRSGRFLFSQFAQEAMKLRQILFSYVLKNRTCGLLVINVRGEIACV